MDDGDRKIVGDAPHEVPTEDKVWSSERLVWSDLDCLKPDESDENNDLNEQVIFRNELTQSQFRFDRWYAPPVGYFVRFRFPLTLPLGPRPKKLPLNRPPAVS